MNSKIIFAVCIIALCLSGLDSKPATTWSRGGRGKIGKARVLSAPIPPENKGNCDFVVKTNANGELELICVKKSEGTPQLNSETGCTRYERINDVFVCTERGGSTSTALSGENPIDPKEPEVPKGITLSGEKDQRKCIRFEVIRNWNNDNELVCAEREVLTTPLNVELEKPKDPQNNGITLSGEKDQRKCIKFEVIRNSNNDNELVCAEREVLTTPLNSEIDTEVPKNTGVTLSGEQEKCNKFDVIRRANGVNELVCVESEVKSTPLNSEKERGKCTKFDVIRNSDNVYELVCAEREGPSTPALNAELPVGTEKPTELNAELTVPKNCDRFVVITNARGEKELICQNDADSARTLKYRRKNASTSSKRRSPFGRI